MKVKLSATIPVVAYGNVEPEIEAEAETYEQALQIAEGRLQDIWNRYCEPGKELRSGTTVRLIDYFGNEIDYDPIAHVYSLYSKVYQSGSKYADTFRKPFDKLKIAEATANRDGTKVEDILAKWELKAQASRDFGNSVHEALEYYEVNGQPLDNPTLKSLTESFYASHKGEKAVSEVLVVDHVNKRAGRIDRLLVTGDKTCVVCDIKTDTDIEKNKPIHQQQLSFYASILKVNGWTVECLRLHHFNGKWADHDLPVLEVK